MRKKKTQEQFLIDLWNKNKYYREGMFEVIGQYVETHTKILIKNKYGICAAVSGGLLRGGKPHIMSAIDKNDYFINMCVEKFDDDGINDLSQIEYVNSVTKIKVIDIDYGEYFITPSEYLVGKRNAKRGPKSVSEKLMVYNQHIKDRIELLHPELKFNLTNCINVNQYLEVKNKYGVCKLTINSILRGSKPTISSAVNKTDYFINQAKEIHGDKYDYSLVEWKSAKTKVKIIGKYGIFEQNPYSHLAGIGCPFEARDKIGWTTEKWKLSAESSKDFTGYKVYFLECWDENEKFYKIGRTYKDVSERFKRKALMPYFYKILHTIELDDPMCIYEKEIKLKQQHSKFKYIPSKKFGGMYECFSQLNLNECF